MAKKFNIARPASYHIPKDTCGTCRHIFFTMEYEECARYYCMYKARRRPLCGSTLMGESFFISRAEGATEKQADRTFSRRMRAWERWSKNREVESLGTCAHYGYEKPETLTARQVYGNDKVKWKR